MKFPATDIEHSMQDEIDRLKARIKELEAELENYARLALARIRELEGERDRLREALGRAGFGGEAIRAAIDGTIEECARIVEKAQIFHCWGDQEINGLDVQSRLAAAIRARAALGGGK
jgi:uncharacterized protein YlxW (UPF0749 family)